jgi:hypothetical protein
MALINEGVQVSRRHFSPGLGTKALEEPDITLIVFGGTAAGKAAQQALLKLL